MLKPGGALTKQFGFDPSDLTTDPGYKFQLQQGDQAATRSATAAGNGNSGNLDTALAQYNQGLAGTTFNNAYNRALTTFQTNRQNTLQPLSTLINAGQTATGQFNAAQQNAGNQTSANDIYGGTYVGNAGINASKSIADLLLGIGNAKAGGSIAQGNIWGNFLGGPTGQAAGTAIYNSTPSFGSAGNAIAGAALGI